MSPVPAEYAEEGFVEPELGIRLAFDELAGGPVTVAELFRRFGTTASIAEAAGYGGASTHPPRSDGRRARDSFMRALRRMRSSGRVPAGRQAELQRIVARARLVELVESIEAEGLTFAGVVLVQVSDDLVVRTFPAPGRFISPRIWAQEGLGPLLRARRWPSLVDPFASAMGRAYGVYFRLVAVEYLRFTVGRVRGAQAGEV